MPPDPAASSAERLLIIEDNRDLAEGLAFALQEEGYTVDIELDGIEGLRAVRSGSYDLVVLDLSLPELDGLELLRRLRCKDRLTPVLILSARAAEMEKLVGFRTGADDYVVKPFSLLELLARIQALLRRASRGQHRTVCFGDVEVDLDAEVVRRRGELVDLTPRAFELLTALIRRQGAVARRDELLREVWGFSRTVQTRTIDTHISELRRQLESDPGRPRHIITVWKRGYRLDL